jgi:hypothetical protein
MHMDETRLNAFYLPICLAGSLVVVLDEHGKCLAVLEHMGASCVVRVEACLAS